MAVGLVGAAGVTRPCTGREAGTAPSTPAATGENGAAARAWKPGPRMRWPSRFTPDRDRDPVTRHVLDVPQGRTGVAPAAGDGRAKPLDSGRPRERERRRSSHGRESSRIALRWRSSRGAARSTLNLRYKAQSADHGSPWTLLPAQPPREPGRALEYVVFRTFVSHTDIYWLIGSSMLTIARVLVSPSLHAE